MSVTFHYKPNGTWATPDRRMQFPAGEEHIVDEASEDLIPTYAVVRGADANDYISAAMWMDLQRQRGHEAALIVPYLPGARQDRGKPFGAKVYADLINMVGARQVITFDPHSPVMPSLIDNLDVFELAEVLPKALGLFTVPDGIDPTTYDGVNTRYDGVIIPDKGAVDRTTKVAKVLGLPTYQAYKVRDFATGKLTGFDCDPLPEGGRFLIPDDICDGGGTFMGLVAAAGLEPWQVDLWVSHGVFSGPDEKMQALRATFGTIFTTDSHPNYARTAAGATSVSLLPYLTRFVDSAVEL